MNRYLLIIKNEVKEALSESKNLIFLLFVIFIASVVLGIIFHDAIYDSISPVIDNPFLLSEPIYFFPVYMVRFK